MKRLLFYLIVAFPQSGFSQNTYRINLSKTLHETRMGVWAKGDYKIYIELGIAETTFTNTAKGFINAGANNNSENTVDSIYLQMAKRFQKAAGQLKKARNGFDLRKLVVYYGPENEKENSGNSFIVESIVRQLLESGRAAVYYKCKRVYNLTKRDEPNGEGVDFGYDMLIYFNDAENYIFKYHEHLGW